MVELKINGIMTEMMVHVEITIHRSDGIFIILLYQVQIREPDSQRVKHALNSARTLDASTRD